MSASASPGPREELEIHRLVAETRKLVFEGLNLAAERDKLSVERDRMQAERETFAAERDKLAAEADKLRRDRGLAPWLLAIAAAGAVVAAAPVVLRLLGSLP